MPRIVKIVLVALVVGGVLAGGLFYLGKTNFEESERRMGGSVVP